MGEGFEVGWVLNGIVVGSKNIKGKKDGKLYSILTVSDGRASHDVFMLPEDANKYSVGDTVSVPGNVSARLDGRGVPELKFYPADKK